MFPPRCKRSTSLNNVRQHKHEQNKVSNKAIMQSGNPSDSRRSLRRQQAWSETEHEAGHRREEPADVSGTKEEGQGHAEDDVFVLVEAEKSMTVVVQSHAAVWTAASRLVTAKGRAGLSCGVLG